MSGSGEIRFVGPEYDGVEEELGGLAEKLTSIVNDTAFNKFGKEALLNPSDIEVTPAVLDEPLFVVRAWHQTGGEQSPGIVQAHDFSFRITPSGEDMYIELEDDRMYALTTRETLLLISLANVAMIKSLLGSQ